MALEMEAADLEIRRSGIVPHAPIPHVAHFTVLLLYSITLNIVCLYPERRGNIMYHDVHPKQASTQASRQALPACLLLHPVYVSTLLILRITHVACPLAGLIAGPSFPFLDPLPFERVTT